MPVPALTRAQAKPVDSARCVQRRSASGFVQGLAVQTNIFQITSLHHRVALSNMPKRKREGAESPEASSCEEQTKSMRQRRVEHKVDQGHKILNKAFKTAKGFERQKLGRRRKTACEKGDRQDVERIDAETEAIKVCSLMCPSLAEAGHANMNAVATDA